MARHTASNHQDCFIDCPGDEGFAYYIEPRGPCMRDCNNSRLANALAKVIKEHGWGVKLSATVGAMTRSQLFEFAQRLKQVSSGSNEVVEILNELERLSFDSDRLIHIEWENVSVTDA